MEKGLDGIRFRMASTYTIPQIIRAITALGLLLMGGLVFPKDFPYVSRNLLFCIILYGLIVLWQITLRLIINRQLERAVSPKAVSRLLKQEARGFGILLMGIATVVPLPEPYYVNIGWVLSIFLYTWVLANPYTEFKLSAFVALAPLAGWILHSLMGILFYSRGLHLPALLFCLAVSFGLFWARDYFIRHYTRHALDMLDLRETDALSRLNADPRYKDFEQKYIQAKKLSAREGQILDGILRGRITKEIASELNISEATIKTHIQNIFGKVGVRSRLELYADFNAFCQLKSR